MAVFFTSDTHFGHHNIIASCGRPFPNVETMDREMIARWNARVSPKDIVYHLGDFCHRNDRAAAEYLSALNGNVHLVAGNHDVETLQTASGHFASIHIMLEVKAEGQTLVLCHYPLREWRNAWSGAWHLFGHVHGRLDEVPLGRSLDVGVDSHDFYPWSFEEIAAALAQRSNPFTPGRRRQSTRPPA
jgi:calcineurin-like phosphoesterase family protein